MVWFIVGIWFILRVVRQLWLRLLRLHRQSLFLCQQGGRRFEKSKMKTSELQLGDIVSCLGDPVIVVSLSFNGDEPIGTILPLTNSPLTNIFTFREKDVYPIRLDESMLMQNNFNPEIVAWWRPEGEDFFKIAIMNEDTSLCAKVKYVHELQHALRLCGLSELAENLKV